MAESGNGKAKPKEIAVRAAEQMQELLGKPVDDLRYRFDNTFLVHYTAQPGWHKVTGAQTVFHDAQENGWRTAVVGWYNPYCGIYGDAIDQCYWETMTSSANQRRLTRLPRKQTPTCFGRRSQILFR